VKRGLRSTIAAMAGAAVVTLGLTGALGAAPATSAPIDGAAAAGGPDGVAAMALPLGHAGRWVTDAQGRVVIVHGLNQVYKIPPYEPSADGFGANDSAFLAANGFNVVRVGVIWAGVEPEPGVFNNAYLASIAATVRTLAAHGIVSLLDFHQDLYNEVYQGEGAPSWAVQSGGLPNPKLGFPGNYLANPALEYNLDQFWDNAPGPDGIGLQDWFAGAWAHTASYFNGNPDVLGYELYNEPFPGTLWETCAVPAVGCPLFDAKLTAFYDRVAAAIRQVDPQTMVWYEPNVIFNDGVPTRLGSLPDANVGFAFHDYPLSTNLGGAEDPLVFANAAAYAGPRQLPVIMTEFGATEDLGLLESEAARADNAMIGWIEWAYTGNDITSSSPEGQALVYNPELPPTGTNVDTAKLVALARPYPELTSGVPIDWSFDPTTKVFGFAYSTARAAGGSPFAGGSVTSIAAPRVQYRTGYHPTVVGGQVVSAPDAALLEVASCPGAATISVTIDPGAGSSTGSC
jgi:endoglycosylceramidase